MAFHNFETHLIAADGKGDEFFKNVHIWDVGAATGRLQRFFKTTKKVYLKALEVNADIYHFHDPELIPIGLKLKNKDTKIIYDIHEDYRTQIKIKPWINIYLRGVISFLFGKYENYASKKFDGLLVPQIGMIEYFDHINPNTKFVANSMIIEDVSYDLDKKDYTNKLCFHPGSLTEARGVFNMINVFEYLEDEKLILAGAFDSNVTQDRAKRSEGWEKVEYIGKRPYSEIKEYHKKASLGLILFENIGQSHFAYTVKLFEYMYFGTPVLLPNFGDWVPFNEKYKCGINVDPKEPNKIAEKIRELNENPALKRKLGENGRKAIMEGLNWGEDEKRLLHFYESM